jgi:antiviral helicase SKI2
MLYKGADLIRDVEFVIFDEVHYVNDAEVQSKDPSREPILNAETARRCLGGSDNNASGPCQHHSFICDGAKHKGVCRLGWVCLFLKNDCVAF